MKLCRVEKQIATHSFQFLVNVCVHEQMKSGTQAAHFSFIQFFIKKCIEILKSYTVSRANRAKRLLTDSKQINKLMGKCTGF